MSDGPSSPSSYEPFRAPRRVPHYMQTPWCNICQKEVDSWLYHRTGHKDETPLLIVRCHGVMIVEGTDQANAPTYRADFESRYLSGAERLEVRGDGTLSYSNTGYVTGPVSIIREAPPPKDLGDL